MRQTVKGYARKPYRVGRKLVKPKSTGRYTRSKRPKSTKRIVGKKPIKLYPVYNSYHERMGWSRKSR